MTRPRERFLSDRDELARELARELEQLLASAVDQRGSATLAVSGGNTPLPLFRRLRQSSLPWRDITITLVDERWVDAEHPDSNAAFVHRELLQEAAAEATFVDLYHDFPTPELGQPAAEQTVGGLPWPLDAVILGMGGDGHTASLFPATDDNRRALTVALDLARAERCAAIRPGIAPHPRMSLTLSAILSCRRLFLHITGEAKKRVYEQALQPGSAEELPIRSVLHQDRQAVEVYWAP